MIFLVVSFFRHLIIWPSISSIIQSYLLSPKLHLTARGKQSREFLFLSINSSLLNTRVSNTNLKTKIHSYMSSSPPFNMNDTLCNRWVSFCKRVDVLISSASSIKAWVSNRKLIAETCRSWRCLCYYTKLFFVCFFIFDDIYFKLIYSSNFLSRN